MLAEAMGLIQRLRGGFAALKGEPGFAVPTVLAVMVIGLGFSAVAVSVAVTTQGDTSRDLNHKAALAIADAGVQRAFYTYNKITTHEQTPCVLKGGYGAGASLSEGRIGSNSPYCDPIGGTSNADFSGIDPDSKVGSGYFTYWVSPCVGEVSAGRCTWVTTNGTVLIRPIKIVSQGCSNTSPSCAGGVIRRVAIAAHGKPGSLSTGDAKAIGLDSFTMEGWSELEVPGATNGDFVMKHQGGCPGTGSDRDGQYDGSPLDSRNGCPRVCPGDWDYTQFVSVGPGKQMVTPSGTQICNANKNLTLGCDTDGSDPYHAGPGCPRVNPPGPPESIVCSATFNSPGIPSKGIRGCTEADQRTISLEPIKLDANLKNTNDDGRLPINCTVTWTNKAAYDAWVAQPRPKPPAPAPIYTENPTGCASAPDSVSGPGTVRWNSATRTLTLDGTGDSGHRFTVDLGGRNYVLCKLVMTGDSVINVTNTTAMANTDHVASKIFIDSPENCPPDHPTTQLDISDASTFESATWDPFKKKGNGTDIGLLPLVAMVGSPDTRTTAYFHTEEALWQAQKVMLYAPLTDVILDTGIARENEGWFAGRTLSMIHGSEIESPPDLGSIGVDIASPDYTVFTRDAYVECGAPGPLGSSPDTNC